MQVLPIGVFVFFTAYAAFQVVVLKKLLKKTECAPARGAVVFLYCAKAMLLMCISVVLLVPDSWQAVWLEVFAASFLVFGASCVILFVQRNFRRKA